MDHTHNPNTQEITKSQNVVYSCPFVVPFFWADPAGILFFGNIYLAAHQIWEAWAKSKDGLWWLWFQNENEIAYPLRNSSADFLKPMKYGAEFTASIKVESVTSSTFVLVTEFSAKGSIYATVRSVHTALNTQTMTKDRLPPGWAQFLTKSP